MDMISMTVRVNYKVRKITTFTAIYKNKRCLYTFTCKLNGAYM